MDAMATTAGDVDGPDPRAPPAAGAGAAGSCGWSMYLRLPHARKSNCRFSPKKVFPSDTYEALVQGIAIASLKVAPTMRAASLLLPRALLACLWLIPAASADFTNFCVQAQYTLGTCADASVVARDLIFVLDKSSSMNITYVNYNALQYCQQLYCGFDGTAGSQVGLISFGCVARCIQARAINASRLPH